jgi:hypothetical protein
VNARGKDEALNKLDCLHASGLISIHKTDVMDTEMLYGSLTKPAKGPYFAGLAKSVAYEEDVGVFVVGHSRLDHGKLGDDPNSPDVDTKLPIHEMSDDGRLNAIAEVLFPGRSRGELLNDMRDVMHLATHALYRHDIFVTRNTKDFIHTDKQDQDGAKREILRARYGIVVMTPEEALEEVRCRLRHAS